MNVREVRRGPQRLEPLRRLRRVARTAPAKEPFAPFALRAAGATILAPPSRSRRTGHSGRWSPWQASASYLGSYADRLWGQVHLNPGTFMGLGPCTIAGVSYPSCTVTGNVDRRQMEELPLQGRNWMELAMQVKGITASAVDTTPGVRMFIARQTMDGPIATADARPQQRSHHDFGRIDVSARWKAIDGGWRRRFRATAGRGRRATGHAVMKVLKSLMWRAHVGELRQERHVVRRHAVAELAEELAGLAWKGFARFPGQAVRN